MKKTSTSPAITITTNYGNRSKTRHYRIAEGMCYIPHKTLRLKSIALEPSEYWQWATLSDGTNLPIRAIRGA